MMPAAWKPKRRRARFKSRPMIEVCGAVVEGSERERSAAADVVEKDSVPKPNECRSQSVRRISHFIFRSGQLQLRLSQVRLG